MSNRRTTLGPISQSSLNSRLSMGPRVSLGPSKASFGESKRASMAIPQTQQSVSLAQRPMGTVGATTASRRSSIVGAPPSRRSSILPKPSIGTTRIITDPRNISDRNFVQNSMKILIDYLVIHGYDQQISLKVLNRPSLKDFTNIVTFLFHQIDSNFNLNGKFEDDLVLMFKFLGYPFQIAKSHISGVGTPHAWPSMLACLIWLIELLSYDEEVGLAKEDDPLLEDLEDFSSPSQGDPDRSFYRYLRQAYGLFMTGQDDAYAALEEKFLGSLQSRNEAMEQECMHLEQQNQGLLREIADAEQQSRQLPELTQTLRDLNEDWSNFQLLVEQLDNHRQQMMSYHESKKKENEALSGEIAQLTHDIELIRNKLAHQEISLEDVQHLLAEKSRLEKEVEEASRHRQSLQRNVWAMETSLGDKLQTLEEKLKNYHRVAEELQLLNTPLLGGQQASVDFHIEVNPLSKKTSRLLKVDLRSEILPALQSLRHSKVCQTQELQERYHSQQEIEEEVEQQRSWLENQLQEWESRLKEKESRFQSEKDSWESQLERWNAQLELKKRHWDSFHLSEQEESQYMSNLQRLKNDWQRKLQHLKEEVSTWKAGRDESLIEIVTLAAQHREHVQSRLESLQGEYEKCLQQCLEESSVATSSSPTSMSHSTSTSTNVAAHRFTSSSTSSRESIAPKYVTTRREKEGEKDGGGMGMTHSHRSTSMTTATTTSTTSAAQSQGKVSRGELSPIASRSHSHNSSSSNNNNNNISHRNGNGSGNGNTGTTTYSMESHHHHHHHHPNDIPATYSYAGLDRNRSGTSGSPTITTSATPYVESMEFSPPDTSSSSYGRVYAQSPLTSVGLTSRLEVEEMIVSPPEKGDPEGPGSPSSLNMTEDMFYRNLNQVMGDHRATTTTTSISSSSRPVPPPAGVTSTTTTASSSSSSSGVGGGSIFRFNLTGLIDECAKQDRNLLEESTWN